MEAKTVHAELDTENYSDLHYALLESESTLVPFIVLVKDFYEQIAITETVKANYSDEKIQRECDRIIRQMTKGATNALRAYGTTFNNHYIRELELLNPVNQNYAAQAKEIRDAFYEPMMARFHKMTQANQIDEKSIQCPIDTSKNLLQDWCKCFRVISAVFDDLKSRADQLSITQMMHKDFGELQKEIDNAEELSIVALNDFFFMYYILASRAPVMESPTFNNETFLVSRMYKSISIIKNYKDLCDSLFPKLDASNE